MRKTDKKRENALRTVLTDVCDTAQAMHQGFEWITHLVNYDDFPRSLSIICVFDTNENCANADCDAIRSLIQRSLGTIDIQVKDINRHVRFDTEENCLNQHDGKWNARLK
ncbi:hypothetical protein CS022_10565 [Veronia nyctiphanis]|uniref:Fis family transcriptional regulator n=1 Tax=Veronia nyctiphanis TaxID=1278244 RepID=A0A4Q0YQ29_9GAMM|nr:hypothetical protein [Veronia nyctiphanis]RXJ73190.1 hypothetical protein CS022_10565 [Veronia nyctiphanis]